MQFLRLPEAIAEIMTIHANQQRKGGQHKVPYICHLLQVIGIVIEYNGTEDDAIAAAYHDSIEDQGLHLGPIIEAKWGKNIADVVRECTMEKLAKDATPEEKVKFLFEQREKYLAHLPQASESALRVSCADKLHNLRSLWKDVRMCGEKEFDNFKGKKDGTLWYFWELSKAFKNLPYDFALSTGLEMQRILILIETQPDTSFLFEALKNVNS